MLGTHLHCEGTLKEFQLFPRLPFPGDILARAQVISERTAIECQSMLCSEDWGSPCSFRAAERNARIQLPAKHLNEHLSTMHNSLCLTGSQNMHLFVQEDFSFEIRLEVLHFGPDLLLYHCIEGDTQLVQLGLQGGQVRSLLQKTGMVRGTNSHGSSANQQPLSYRPRAWLVLNAEEEGQQND